MAPSTRRPRRKPEQELQRAVCQFLEVALVPPAFYFAIPNGERRDKITAAILKGQGVKAGIPDLCVVWTCEPRLWGSGVGFIELKALKGHISAAQGIIHNRLASCQQNFDVCHSVDDVERMLAFWGCPLRASSGRVGEKRAAA